MLMLDLSRVMSLQALTRVSVPYAVRRLLRRA